MSIEPRAKSVQCESDVRSRLLFGRTVRKPVQIPGSSQRTCFSDRALAAFIPLPGRCAEDRYCVLEMNPRITAELNLLDLLEIQAS